MKTIYESLVWNEARVTAHAAAQYIPLKYGKAGTTGTRVTLIAGTHGDEGPWSALAIKMFCQHPFAQLTGRLRVIFTANALAAEVERRNSWIDSPNPVDLDSVFPGNKEGSHTDRLAGAIAPLIADSDAVIDLHGGGTWCVNAFVKRFEGSEQLAADLGAPFISNAPNKRGGLTTIGIVIANGEDLRKPLEAALDILVPVTGTDYSRRAAEVALAISGAARARVTALYVSSRPRALFWLGHGHGPDPRELEILNDITRLAKRQGVNLAASLTARAAPEDAIAHEIRKGKHTLVVLGVKMRPGDRLYFGHVPAALQERSPCSLLLVSS